MKSSKKPAVHPETPPPGMYPDGMNEHLQSLWCNVRNSIQADQNAVKVCLSNIRTQKQSIKFLKTRIMANHAALEQLGNIKG